MHILIIYSVYYNCVIHVNKGHLPQQDFFTCTLLTMYLPVTLAAHQGETSACVVKQDSTAPSTARSDVMRPDTELCLAFQCVLSTLKAESIILYMLDM